MLQFDVILDKLGFGLFNSFIIFAVSVDGISSGFNALATVFIAYSPEFRCKVPQLENNTLYPDLTEDDIYNLTSPYDQSSQSYSSCYRFGYDLTSCDGDTSCVNKSYPGIKCDHGYHYDRSLFTETAVTEFNLVCDDKYLAALTTSLYYVGILFASFLAGHLSDAFGRKTCFIISTIGILGSMFGAAYSRSIAMYITFRVVIGFFNYGAILSSYVYLTEIVPKEWRTFVAIGSGIFFSIGNMVFSGIAYHWRNWHDMVLVSTLIYLPFVVLYLFIPESPRWLLALGKEREGLKVINKIARLNKKKISDETWAKARKLGTMDKSNAQKQTMHSSFLDLFRSKSMRWIAIYTMFSWFVTSFVYYGIALNAGRLAGDIFINNTLNGVFDLVAYIFCIVLINRVGRRILLSFSMFLAGLGLLANVVLTEYAGGDQGLITLGVAFAFAAKFGISASFAIIYIFTCELFPTVVRSKGVAIGSIAARFGGIAAPFWISLQDLYSWLPNTLSGVLGVAAGLLALLFPETNGQPMAETIKEAEQFYESQKKRKIFMPKYDSNNDGWKDLAAEEDNYTRL